ncbi:phosphopantetheine-binding protein [Lipingzhangella sp. LS1_29]|uniref:Phosphopantetheine-binding protein n=1 Tax=Lipingzhangella rawalii TaxID=2055835 RepID=A0ABU2HA88_9ACTN|nr:phosphopantetheine-binding protein [Lipingzhangella rawalii]MDS1271519.1 phosphopantetheine-binding protein [Lipingzhangella rawalii]
MTDSSDDIQQRVRAVLHRQLGEDAQTIATDEDLAAVLGERYDSLTAMECVTGIEDAFAIEVDFVAHDVRYWFSTVGRMTEFVRNELEDRAVLERGQ